MEDQEEINYKLIKNIVHVWVYMVSNKLSGSIPDKDLNLVKVYFDQYKYLVN